MGFIPLPVLLSVAVFVAMLVSVTLLGWAFSEHSAARERQIEHRVGGTRRVALVQRAEGKDGARAAERRGRLASWLRQAGDPMDVSELVLRMVLGGVAGLVVTMVVLDGPISLLGAAMVLLPLLRVQRMAELRNHDISVGLPTAIDLMIRTLRAGHGLTDALRICSEELEGPVGEELGRVAEENQLGRELRECFQRMLERNPESFDLRLLTSAVLLQRETGGNLVELLDHLGRTIRDRVLFEGKVDALTAEVRFSAMVLVALPFFIAGVLLLIRPGYLTPLYTTPLGQAMLLGGMVSLVVGILVMRRLAQVEA
ncbi:MAG: type II secretion system F family protein [Alphaproteobacteria bacterium]|nr:type II secretion system F family protein [Alphaproteobacteria bacterium]